jgi:hypothetical protein
MGELAAFKKTPVRSLSRRGKDQPQQKTVAVAQKNNENENKMKLDLQKEKQRLARDVLKRDEWLQDERHDILKHSELDHIFNNKLNKIYDLDDIKPSTLPRPRQSESYLEDVQSKRNNFQIKQRNRRST